MRPESAALDGGNVIETGEQHTNRLINEKSPYLLQHAHNPVDWYPWGAKAFKRARAEDKPVFLSIGYSTCHWCHVMEQESFSDPGMAALMNERFVCIKVDREERPDIDQIYMGAVVGLTGRGGWPLTLFLTPDQKPFYGGTYFPPEDRYGIPGLRSVLLSVADAWKTRREEVLRSGDMLTGALGSRRPRGRAEGAALNEATLSAAYHHFKATFDSVHGGFGGAPKFPMGQNLSFLLRYARREKHSEALMMAEKSLTAMAGGGVYDHLGGGFHRYSTDGQWRIPHFEKMLYDQAILSRAYLDAYQATGREIYAQVARRTLNYVLRDMTGNEGGLYSAEDADSPLAHNPGRKGEGEFYLWKKDDVMSLLGEEHTKVLSLHFGIEQSGNAVSDPHGEFGGKNVLYTARTVEETARELGRSRAETEGIIQGAVHKLLQAREERPRPHLDDKVLTGWNGLMISSLAFAYRVLEEPAYREAAERSARFIIENLVADDGRLHHRYRDGEAGIAGTLDDYAFFIHGLIDLYEATFNVSHLVEADRLARLMCDLFWDDRDGGFFFTARGGEQLIIRNKEVYDGAIPSGNSVACLDLLRLGRMTANTEFESRARTLMRAFSDDIAGLPASHSFMLAALDFDIGPSNEIVLAAGGDPETVRQMVRVIYGDFIPNKVVLLRPATEVEAQPLLGLAPFAAEYRPVEGRTAAYVCANHACRAPARSFEELRHLLTPHRESGDQ